MFKINIPISKAKREDGKLLIEGTASGTLIDLANDRFSEEAIQKMADSVNGKNIPIIAEHDDHKFYTEVGKWNEARIENNTLYVKGEIYTDLSLGSDIAVLLSKGMNLGLSVGGQILEMGNEYDKNSEKTVRVLKDVVLKEISVVKNPCYETATMNIAKSFNPEKQEEVVIKKKLTNEEFKKEISYKLIKVPKLEKTVTLPEAIGIFKKEAESPKIEIEVEVTQPECECCVEMESEKFKLTPADIKLINIMIAVFNAVDSKTMEKPKDLEDYEFVDSLPEESFILGIPYRIYPHHNADFTINEEWLTYWIYKIVSGDIWWLSAEELSISLNHLYHHFRAMTKTAPVTDTETVQKTESVEITEAELKLLKDCHEFSINKGVRPQVDGNDLSDKEVAKMAGAYTVLLQRCRKTIGKQMIDSAKPAVVKSEVTEEVKTEEVTKSEETKEVKTEVVEAVVKTEETVVSSEQKDETITKTEDVKVEQPAGEPVVKAVTEEVKQSDVETTTLKTELEKSISVLKDELTSAVNLLSADVATLKKSVAETAQSFEKSSKGDGKLELLEKKVVDFEEIMTKAVPMLEKIAQPRKSFTIIEKTIDSSNGKSVGDVTLEVMDEAKKANKIVTYAECINEARKRLNIN